MNIYDAIINKKQDMQIYTGVLSSLSPLKFQIYTSDTELYCKCIKGLAGLKVGSNIMLMKIQNQFIIIGVIGSHVDTAPQWQSWSPTLTWGTATPDSLVTIAKYHKVGTLVHFMFECHSSDGNNASSLTISLPVNEKGDNIHSQFSCSQVVNGVWADNLISFCNADAETHVIEFRNFDVCSNALTFYLFVSGFYEAAE